MFRALDENKNEIYATDANKKNKYFCPYCQEELVLRQGDLVEWHFAHKSNSDCVDTGEMCEWHLRMQSYFPKENREVRVSKDGKTHIADILKDEFVIEFQHSSISYEDFNERNDFYTSLGYKVIWVFDSTEWWETGKLSDLHDGDDNLFRLKRPISILKYSNLDSDKISICFCDYDGENDFVFNVYWHNDDWTIIGMDMSYNATLMSDDIDLHTLFYNSYDWKYHFLKGTDTQTIFRGIKGYPKYAYLCKGTNDWASNCQFCKCCKLIEFKLEGSIIYCDKKSKYNISDDYYAPMVYIKS